jgi:hypothetical protein
MFKVACNSGFKQRGAANFDTTGNSSLAGIVNAARQSHVRCASADATAIRYHTVQAFRQCTHVKYPLRVTYQNGTFRDIFLFQITTLFSILHDVGRTFKASVAES